MQYVDREVIIRLLDWFLNSFRIYFYLKAGIANRGWGGGVLPPLPPSLEPQTPPPPPLAASEASRHFFSGFFKFFRV